jgi:GH24 family phage-related lysozyme (muramidase)
MYQQAIEYIQFLGNRKNIRTLGDNIQSLQRIFAETFEVAKIIRQTIIKIVKQLSNLPTASTGGGGLNLDVNVPGGPLRRSAPRGLNRMLKIAGTGAAIAGAGALGSKVVSGMMDIGDGDVQPVVGDGSEGLSGPILDRFNAILDRFSAAIDSLSRRPPSKPSAPGGGGGGGTQEKTDTGGGGGGGGGGVTATGSEQQKTEALIAGEEGVALKAYQNPGDVPTIGYGETKGVRLGDTITKEKAVVRLRGSIESHRKTAIKQVGAENWNKLDENTKVVLTSVAYNYGSLPPRIMPAVKSGDSEKIAQSLSLLHGDNGGILKGRREREAQFIRSGTSPKLDKDFLAGGKLAAPGGSVSTTTPVATTQITPPSVAAAPTQAATAQQVSQTVAQPPPQQQSQVNILPMNLGSAQPQQSQKSATPSSPPPAMSSGRNLITLSSANHDNFLTLYSKMVYNIVDG